MPEFRFEASQLRWEHATLTIVDDSETNATRRAVAIFRETAFGEDVDPWDEADCGSVEDNSLEISPNTGDNDQRVRVEDALTALLDGHTVVGDDDDEDTDDDDDDPPDTDLGDD